VGLGVRYDEDALQFPGLSKPPRVYVDAKILNVHDPMLAREAYVGYVIEGSNRHDATRVDATESDDAEVMAILFAIDELKDQFRRFTIVCDHESVVSEAKRSVAKRPSELMKRLRDTLKQNPSIGLEVLKANPAHGMVTEYVNKLKAEPEDGLAGGVGPASEVPDQRNS
jgi:ribonuclease HI